MKAFAALYQALEHSTGTLDKRAVIADYVRRVPREDAAWGLWLLAGNKLRRIAGSGELRKAMFELIFIPRKTHTEIQFIEHEEKAFEVPDGWLGRYFPSFLPKGYETVQVTSAAEGSSLVSFMNNDGDLMHFSENTSDTYTSIDTEDADVSNVLIRGYKGLMSVKEGRVILVWSADERYFVLNIDGDEKLAIEIAESLRLVR